MRILIADDDEVARLELESLLSKHGYEVVATADGTEAWHVLQGEGAPRLAILDWMMSEMDGIDVCRLARQAPKLQGMYLILLASRTEKQYIIEGLKAGANDYITKPFDRDELLARISVGIEVVQLRDELAARVRELEGAMAQVKQLQGLLPMCSYCKKVRDEANYWQRVEDYITSHSDAQCSHGICPECWESVVKPEFRKQGIAVPDECPS